MNTDERGYGNGVKDVTATATAKQRTADMLRITANSNGGLGVHEGLVGEYLSISYPCQAASGQPGRIHTGWAILIGIWRRAACGLAKTV
jgi:hypothetical protein